jgi:hypothetical protein
MSNLRSFHLSSRVLLAFTVNQLKIPAKSSTEFTNHIKLLNVFDDDFFIKFIGELLQTMNILEIFNLLILRSWFKSSISEKLTLRLLKSYAILRPK